MKTQTQTDSKATVVTVTHEERLTALNNELNELTELVISNNKKLSKSNLKAETRTKLDNETLEAVEKIKLIKNEISEVSAQALNAKLSLIETTQKEVSEALGVTDDLVLYQKNTDKRKALKEMNDSLLTVITESFREKLTSFKSIDLGLSKKQILERVFTALKMELESKTEGKDAVKILKDFEKYYTSSVYMSGAYFNLFNIRIANKHADNVPTKLLNTFFTDTPAPAIKGLLMIVNAINDVKKTATEAEIKELVLATSKYFTLKRDFDTSLCPMTAKSTQEDITAMYNAVMPIVNRIKARTAPMISL